MPMAMVTLYMTIILSWMVTNAILIPAKMGGPVLMDVQVTLVDAHCVIQELAVNISLAIFDSRLAMPAIFVIVMDGGTTVIHTWRSLQLMKMVTQSLSQHENCQVILIQTGTSG